ncbi:ComE operon protein 1 [Methylophilaceae bacterium]|nr:ComE operon protein 1 [Methylophilaceae bacterium]
MNKIRLAIACFFFFLFTGPAQAAVDINMASAAELETISGIGPKKAQAIVEYRKKNGPFKSADDLQKVKGLSKASVEKMRKDITVVNPEIHAGTIE